MQQVTPKPDQTNPPRTDRSPRRRTDRESFVHTAYRVADRALSLWKGSSDDRPEAYQFSIAEIPHTNVFPVPYWLSGSDLRKAPEVQTSCPKSQELEIPLCSPYPSPLQHDFSTAVQPVQKRLTLCRLSMPQPAVRKHWWPRCHDLALPAQSAWSTTHSQPLACRRTNALYEVLWIPLHLYALTSLTDVPRLLSALR